MLMTMVFSAIFFSFRPTLSWACGFAICVISLFLYKLPLKLLIAGDAALETIQFGGGRRSSPLGRSLGPGSLPRPPGVPKPSRSREPSADDLEAQGLLEGIEEDAYAVNLAGRSLSASPVTPRGAIGETGVV